MQRRPELFSRSGQLDTRGVRCIHRAEDLGSALGAVPGVQLPVPEARDVEARHVDIGPASCEDPGCDADHGWTGMQVPNDLTVRMSPVGDGDSNTRRLLDFGALLQSRVG